ncbi:MAG: hypothetical protein ABIJ34_07100 [archaeon]
MKQKHSKTHVLLKGSALHAIVYALIAIALTLLGVPPVITFVVIMVLVWGLFVMGYAYYYHK